VSHIEWWYTSIIMSYPQPLYFPPPSNIGGIYANMWSSIWRTLFDILYMEQGAIYETYKGGYIYLKVWLLFVKGLWLSFKSMKVIFYYYWYYWLIWIYIYNMYLDVVVIIYYTTIYRGMHVPWGGVCVYIYVHKLKYWDKDWKYIFHM